MSFVLFMYVVLSIEWYCKQKFILCIAFHLSVERFELRYNYVKLFKDIFFNITLYIVKHLQFKYIPYLYLYTNVSKIYACYIIKVNMRYMRLTENDFNQYLNVRGLRDKTKRIKMFTWLKNKNLSIIFLQETHCTNELEDVWRTGWGHKVFFSNKSSHSGGVCILLDKSLQYDVISCHPDPLGRYILLLKHQIESYCYVTFMLQIR